MTVAETASLWQAYQKNRSPQLRHQIILNYLPLVRYIAGRLAVNLPVYLGREDLISYGVLGLIEAVDRFDCQRNIKFETYAVARIRGAILDGLRKNSLLPRSIFRKLRQLSEVYQQLQHDEQEVNDQTLAKALGVSETELRELWQQLHTLSVLSLEDFLLAKEGDTRRVGEMITDSDSPDPEGVYLEQELHQELMQAITTLGEQDRLVLSLSYFEELTLKEIGAVLGVSESRACQLRTRALLKLRNKLGESGNVTIRRS
ncbi:MAG: FliA/WhiG family RNA polymerase sigma factor [Bacillota bacterium]|jgi:RNA polymerase sigma factor for flagellar operon FliA